MQNAIARMIKKISRLPLFNRLRCKFSGYKAQVFFDSVCKKAPKYILVVSVVLVIVYISLHPLDKIKIRYFFTHNCTITVISKNYEKNNGYNSSIYYEDRSEILIDKDWIRYKGDYYNLDDENVYLYSKGELGKWEKTEYSDNIFPESFYLLSDKNNYTRDKDNPFVWVLKEDVYKELLGFHEIKVERVSGFISITGNMPTNGYNREISICFRKFGTTNIVFPWED